LRTRPSSGNFDFLNERSETVSGIGVEQAQETRGLFLNGVPEIRRCLRDPAENARQSRIAAQRGRKRFADGFRPHIGEPSREARRGFRRRLRQRCAKAMN
jgi:hypothetical protein